MTTRTSPMHTGSEIRTVRRPVSLRVPNLNPPASGSGPPPVIRLPVKPTASRRVRRGDRPSRRPAKMRRFLEATRTIVVTFFSLRPADLFTRPASRLQFWLWLVVCTLTVVSGGALLFGFVNASRAGQEILDNQGFQEALDIQSPADAASPAALQLAAVPVPAVPNSSPPSMPAAPIITPQAPTAGPVLVESAVYHAAGAGSHEGVWLDGAIVEDDAEVALKQSP